MLVSAEKFVQCNAIKQIVSHELVICTVHFLGSSLSWAGSEELRCISLLTKARN